MGGAAVIAVAAIATVASTRPGSTGTAAATAPTVPASPDGGDSSGVCEHAIPPAADVDGDGCVETVHVDGRTVSAGGTRWALGEPGDLVTVGDWHCGGATPVLLRPTTGEVFVFDGWAAPGEPVTVEPTRRVAAATGLDATPSADGCDRLVVRLAGGTSTTLEIGGPTTPGATGVRDPSDPRGRR
jgi:hypothetical protein